MALSLHLESCHETVLHASTTTAAKSSQSHIACRLLAYPRCVVCAGLKGVVIRAHSDNVALICKARDTAHRCCDLLAYKIIGPHRLQSMCCDMCQPCKAEMCDHQGRP